MSPPVVMTRPLFSAPTNALRIDHDISDVEPAATQRPTPRGGNVIPQGVRQQGSYIQAALV
jgi:hypothetical protein